jgi:lipoprotein-anchoring transpeptidase ErfK/SrfK
MVYQTVFFFSLYSLASLTMRSHECPMQRSLIFVFVALLASAQSAALAAPRRAVPATPPMVVVAPAYEPARSNLGGGFIEFLFGDRGPQVAAPPPNLYPEPSRRPIYANAPAAGDPAPEQRAPGFRMDPRFQRQEVAYDGKEAPGTVVIDTPNHFLYLVEEDGKAIRYGIGVGRPGFTWSGTHEISAKKEWPDWVPPKEMLARQPYLPHMMAGGPNNPLGARALYLGSTLYRIHGSNEPWTIGHNVSSGCIRMRNADVIDLYERVTVGTKVKVL